MPRSDSPARATTAPPSRRRSAGPGPRARWAGAAALGALFTALGSGCSTDGVPGSTGRPLVVATTTQLADFAGVVGGDAVEVRSLLRPDVDAHDFELSPVDVDALARADVVLVNGLGLEPWLDDAMEASGTDADVVVATEGTHLLEAGDHDHDHGSDQGEGDDHRADGERDAGDGDWDPHVWMDPRNAEVMVGHTADALARTVPDAADDIRARADAYREELRELDRWIEAQLATLDDPALVTDHDAIAYYVDRYDLTFVGSVIPSADSAAEVSPGDLNDLADAIEEQGVAAVFTERSLPPDAAEALARRTQVEVVAGDDGLYTDSLGPEGSPGATYLGMLRHNTTTIVEHLS